MTRTALEVCKSFEITGPDGDDMLKRSDVLAALDEVVGGVTLLDAPNTIKIINRIKELPARPIDDQFEQLIHDVETRPIPESLTEPPETPDYRFGRLVKGEVYAYARGLLVSPTHLPKALDAMEADGWSLLAIFGETDAENVGFIFKRVSVEPVRLDDNFDGRNKS
jgi:hypothetical protein